LHNWFNLKYCQRLMVMVSGSAGRAYKHRSATPNGHSKQTGRAAYRWVTCTCAYATRRRHRFRIVHSRPETAPCMTGKAACLVLLHVSTNGATYWGEGSLSHRPRLAYLTFMRASPCPGSPSSCLLVNMSASSSLLLLMLLLLLLFLSYVLLLLL